MLNSQRILDLLQQVPRPPEDILPNGVAGSVLDDFEGRTGIRLPSDLRSWLRLTNGPCVGPGGFYGIQTSRPHLNIEEYLKIFPDWQKRKWIPVAGDGCGNVYIMPNQREYGLGYPILFVDLGVSSDSPSFVVASDLEHFIIAILEKEMGGEGWPFNQKHVTHFDPQIVKCYDVAFPWIAHRGRDQYD